MENINGLEFVKSQTQGQVKFHHALEQIWKNIQPALKRHPEFVKGRAFERLFIADEIFMNQVPWTDDDGKIQIFTNIDVKMDNGPGPYKGGTRWEPEVDLDILNALAAEQLLKNRILRLPIGAGKSGAAFTTKGLSENEIYRACESNMIGLHRQIGADVRVPAGDGGFGSREIGYHYGAYKRITGKATPGAYTGKDMEYGGHPWRKRSTGEGGIQFLQNILRSIGEDVAGQRCILSGKGNVALYHGQGLIDRGGIPISMSDRTGFFHDPGGVDQERLDFLIDLTEVRRGTLKEYADEFHGVTFFPVDKSLDYNPLWAIPNADCALAGATQFEINEKDARNMVKNGIKVAGEGSNISSVQDAITVFKQAGIPYGAAIAWNCAGVGISTKEMKYNAMHDVCSYEQGRKECHEIADSVYALCINTAEEYGHPGDIEIGANIAGFVRAANAKLKLNGRGY